MKKEDIKNEKMYMHTFTGSVDNGRGWLETLETLPYHEEASEDSDDLHLVEVVKTTSGEWVEA